MENAGLDPAEAPASVPLDFLTDEPKDWEETLPFYHTLLTELLAAARERGRLICGWST